jgi:hypothetical protein
MTLIRDTRIQKPTNISVSGLNWALADLEAGLITGAF